MIKYLSYALVLQEIPDEITLAIQITQCPHHCKNCHSPELVQNIGTELTEDEIDKMIKKYPDATCVCFMGGDKDHNEIISLANHIFSKGLKVAMYSGDDTIDWVLTHYLDYYKVGSYQEEKGPLNKETTNQQLFKINRTKNLVEDITNRFWKLN